MYFCVPLSPHLFAGQKSGSRIGPVPAMYLRAPPAFCSAKMPRPFNSVIKIHFRAGQIAAGYRLGPQAKPPSGRLQRAKPAGGAARRGLRPALPPTGKRLPLTHPGQGGDPRLFTADRINNSPRSVRSAPPESAPRSVSFCPFGLLLTLSPARSPRLFLPRGSTPAAVRGSPPAACRWDLPLGVAAHCAGPGRRSCVRRLQ